MPLNYRQLQDSLPGYAERVKTHSQEIEAEENWLKTLLNDPVLESDKVKAKIEGFQQIMGSLYCAKPTHETLMAAYPVTSPPEKFTLIGIDGSQIVPSRHRSLPFGVINLGWIKLAYGSAATPQVQTVSKLIPYEELFNRQGTLITDTEVDAYRDLDERKLLAELLEAGDAFPVVGLTDGPLDVHRSAERAPVMPLLQQEMENTARRLKDQQVIHAGYIDKPGSGMIANMLALSQVPDAQPELAAEYLRRAVGISDSALLKGLLREPGERSAVFEAVAQFERKPHSQAPVHFFYMNVGLDTLWQHPTLVRIEFPSWVTEAGWANILQAIIYTDTQIMRKEPFPYVLSRAHEIAVVAYAEHDEIENMLQREYHAAELPVGRRSNKAMHKSHQGE